MSWYADCQRIIAEVDRALPEWAGEYQVKQALRRVAWRAHQDTSWGRKVWARAARDYMVRRGYISPLTKQYPVAGLPLFDGGAHG